MVVEIQRAYTRSPYKLVVGDFNAKLKSNLQNVSKNGKLLEQVINDFDMKVTDTLPICEGQWTRVNNNNSSERSIIDYLLLSEKLEPNLKELLSKTICSYKVTNDKKTYSDHNAFIFNMHTRIKKTTIVTKLKHNGDSKKRYLKNSNKLQRIQQYLTTVLHNCQIQLIFKSNMTIRKETRFCIIYFKKYQQKKNTQYLSARTNSLTEIKKEQSKISRKGKSERIISQNIIKKIENLLQEKV